MRITRYVALFFTPLIMACQTPSAAAPVPAVLISDDAQSVAQLKTALAKAMGQNSIELGAVALTKRSVIPVLPPRLGDPSNPAFNGNSVAKPTQFELMMDANGCYVVNRKDNTIHKVTDLACRKL